MPVALSSQKSSHWLIVYFPPDEYQESKEKAIVGIEEFLKTKLPPGWKFGDANVEQCPETGKYHYQGYLKTLYCRGTDVKKAIGPRAHIEKSENRLAVQNYSQKEETKVASVQAPPGVPTPWEYIEVLAGKWNVEEFIELYHSYARYEERMDEIALDYIDQLVARDIESGVRGIEFIATNPMFRSAWKKFWRSIIARHNASQNQTQQQTSGTENVQEEGV